MEKKRIKKKRSFSEFARSEIDEVKYVGGFFLFLALFLNFEPRFDWRMGFPLEIFFDCIGLYYFFWYSNNI